MDGRPDISRVKELHAVFHRCHGTIYSSLVSNSSKYRSLWCQWSLKHWPRSTGIDPGKVYDRPKPIPSYSSLRQLRLLPTVHAQEPVDEGPSTMDKLQVRKPTVTVSDGEVQTYLREETGYDRLQTMFRYTPEGGRHHDLQKVVTITTTSGTITFLVMYVLGSKQARERHLLKHKHVQFETKFQAMRSYNDALMAGGFKAGALYGFKTSLFAAIFMLTAQSISTYRNKTSLWEYMAGGALTGGLLRITMGVRGAVAGGVIGTVVGTIGGSVMYAMLYAFGETQDQQHYWEIQEKLRHRKEVELIGSKSSLSVALETIPSGHPEDTYSGTQRI